MIRYPLDEQSLKNVCYALQQAKRFYDESWDGEKHQLTKKEAVLKTCFENENMAAMLLNFMTVFDEAEAEKLVGFSSTNLSAKWDANSFPPTN